MSKPRKQKQSRVELGAVTTLPVLPIREVSPTPGLVVPLYVSKPENVRAVEQALQQKSTLVLTLQSGTAEDAPSKSNLNMVGGIARILQSVRLPNGDLQADVHVIERAVISSFQAFQPYIKAKVQTVINAANIRLSEAEEQRLNDLKVKMAVLAQYEPTIEEHIDTISSLFNPGELSDLTCSVLNLAAIEAQRMLEEFDGSKRLVMAVEFATAQIEARAIKDRISKRAETEVGREQHQELLREQMRLIRLELGESVDEEDELADLTEQLRKLKMPTSARKVAEKQLRRLQQLHPDTSEAALARTYIDWLVDLPWSKRSKDRLDLRVAEKILNEDHFGLEKSKERILDFLGVRKLKKTGRGPILLFVGPPGVGKTSLGRSIAKALGREFVRISLGGLRDEAELRGHRRTYVGALPGRIIQGLKNVGTKNPVFMLDELDKIGSDYRGDPSSVLLEILDPEQNNAFEDHYLNIPFDLSEVMFICTANICDSIPSPLLDRMEVIELHGYTPDEKLQIAKNYLVPREADENGVSEFNVTLSDQTLFHIMNGYTRESGVRELRRCIGTVLRKVARTVAEGGTPVKSISPKLVQKMLGPVVYVPDRRRHTDEIGVVAGLAWTPVGGETLTIEASITKGKGQLSLTGQLGEVMRESAMAALTYVLSRAAEYGADPDFYEKSNVHIHVPHGGIPKDGPSAGVAIATALLSVLTGKPVSKTVAMTGEITLRGSVLPVGGLKEKCLAALRNGMTTVIIPKENERELVEFPKYLREQLTFVPVENIDHAISVALMPKADAATVEKKPTVKRRNLIATSNIQ